MLLADCLCLINLPAIHKIIGTEQKKMHSTNAGAVVCLLILGATVSILMNATGVHAPPPGNSRPFITFKIAGDFPEYIGFHYNINVKCNGSTLKNDWFVTARAECTIPLLNNKGEHKCPSGKYDIRAYMVGNDYPFEMKGNGGHYPMTLNDGDILEVSKAEEGWPLRFFKVGGRGHFAV